MIERIGKYALISELAAGGMATVHLARFHGEAGFSRIVVVKRLHPQFAKDPDFVCMFLDEARLASRVRHPNVVSVYDVVSHRGELLLAMDYVHGVSLSQLVRAGRNAPMPLGIVFAIARDLLAGLHAAHEAKDKRGEPMHIVHRDISPQNLMVGDDGIVRVVDFGIASATARLQTTSEGQVKGKLSYMAPEQIRGREIDRRVDIFAAGIVLWQLVTGVPFADGIPEQRIQFLLSGDYPRPSQFRPEISAEFENVLMKALRYEPSERYSTCEEFSRALSSVGSPAAAFELTEWLRGLVGPLLSDRAMLVRGAEQTSVPPPPPLASNPENASPNYEDILSNRSETRGLPNEDDAEATHRLEVPSEVSKPGPLRRSTIAAALFVFLGVSGAFALARRGGLAPARPNSSESIVSSPTAAAADAHVHQVAEPSPTKEAVAAAVGTVDAATVPSAGAKAPRKSLSAAEQRAKAAPVSAPSRPTSASTPTSGPGVRHKDPCDPPFTLLPGGVRKYKTECL